MHEMACGRYLQFPALWLSQTHSLAGRACQGVKPASLGGAIYPDPDCARPLPVGALLSGQCFLGNTIDLSVTTFLNNHLYAPWVNLRRVSHLAS